MTRVQDQLAPVLEHSGAGEPSCTLHLDRRGRPRVVQADLGRERRPGLRHADPDGLPRGWHQAPVPVGRWAAGLIRRPNGPSACACPSCRHSWRTHTRPGNPAQLRGRQNHATFPSVPVVGRQQVGCCVPACYHMNHHSHPWGKRFTLRELRNFDITSKCMRPASPPPGLVPARPSHNGTPM